MTKRTIPLLFSTILCTSILVSIAGCQSTTNKATPSKKTKPSTAISISCEDPRPEACTAEYLPVCATKDTGIRCITTPCPSTEQVTYSNACNACADKKVFSYTDKSCETINDDDTH